MRFAVVALAYNVFDPGTLSQISDCLLRGADDFGPAVSDLTVTFHFSSSEPARRTLEDDFHRFHANRRRLPKVIFRREKGQATIDVASDLIDGKRLEKHISLTLPLFRGLISETIEALSLLRARLRSRDDFDLDALLVHCRKRQANLPKTRQQFKTLMAQFAREQVEREASLSPWEKLDVHWQDYHRKARELLDDPFFWEEDNDFAPHGNDTGADLLWSYRGWLRRNPSGDPLEFYRRLLRRWGYRADSSRDEGRAVIDEAAVALAFAELKMRGRCRAPVKALAKAALQRQHQQAIEAKQWPHRQERLQSLQRIQEKLLSPNG
jgi:uncharacterized protein YfeS